MKRRPPHGGRLCLHPAAVLVMAALFGVFALAAWLLLRTTEPDPVPSSPEPQEPATTAETRPGPGPLPEIPSPSEHDVVLAPDNRDIPGTTATRWLYYRHPGANQVLLAGAWNGWDPKVEMQAVSPGVWAYPLGDQKTSFGSYEFKFIPDGEWEPGENRIVHFNENGDIERPPRVISQTLMEDPHHLRLVLYQEPERREDVEVELTPGGGELRVEWRLPRLDPDTSGFRMQGAEIEFLFNPFAYDMAVREIERVQVAGTFNGWNPEDPTFRLARTENGTWSVRAPFGFVDGKSTGSHLMFKFIVNGEWKSPPENAVNAMLEPGTPHRNLSVPRGGGAQPELWISTTEPMALSEPPALTVRGLHERTLRVRPSPGKILDRLGSSKPMGATLDRERNQTHYRLFAPRARSVTLGLFDGPYHTSPEGERIEPAERIHMVKDRDGVWEHSREGVNLGQYYAYQVDGPKGTGEGFTPQAWLGDPWAKAVSLAEGNSLVMDVTQTKANPEPRSRVAWEDMVIYETHIRHLTQHPSSGVPEPLRGKYLGLLETNGTGTGLDHLKALGVNVIQFLPIHEFNNGFGDRHDWGYATCFFFAPESSYALDPHGGSQVEEFKQLVEELHRQGFAVFMDVVYNHIGGVNVFNAIDRKYYFRLNPDLTKQNFSGCGNDTASERPMFRRLIKESVLYWVEEYGIDGFRFDLCELIDNQTLSEIEADIRQKHPHVVLHAEPWSFRGSNKPFLGGTTWGAWNDKFREPAKRFVVGHGDKQAVKQAIRGSVETWTRHPLQSVNYMESHDDFSLTDELSSNPGRDGRTLSARDEKIHKLAATLIFSSLGTPMITEGQAFLRSKHGVRNTYNQGDKLNSLRWEERNRPHAREVLSYYHDMIAFRLSPAGSALRIPKGPPPSLEYVHYIEDGSQDALGWIVNANNERPGIPMVMVLMNASEEEKAFEVSLPPGLWRRIGDGERVAPNGIPGTRAVTGGQELALNVPARTAWIFRNGF